MSKGVTEAMVRKLALSLPGMEEGTSYGTPAFRVRKKLVARIHGHEDALVVKVDFDEREILMEADPKTYYITDHYLNSPMILVRLSSVGVEELGDLLEDAWRRCAGRRLIESYDRG